MGFTIDDALREFKKNYKMTLLAGEDGCSNAMSWVQMVEDKTILQQLWGKELVVTTGLGFQSQKKLKEFIEQLVKYHPIQQLSPYIPTPNITTCRFYNDANLIGALYHFLQRQEGC